MPTPDALDDLAHTLQGARTLVRNMRGEWCESEVRHAAFSESLQALKNNLPYLEDQFVQAIKMSTSNALKFASENPMKKYFEAELEKVKRLSSLCIEMDNIWQPIVSTHKSFKALITLRPTWQSMASFSSQSFIEVMASVPRNPSLGFSAGGPVVRFVCAIMPGITGDRPSLETVAAHFKRARLKERGIIAKG